MASSTDFYLRYYVGHKGKFGHEFLEFEFRPDGKLRYANNSNYKNDTMIRKEAFVHKSVMEELKRIIEDSEIMQEDDSAWPSPDRVGRQELEIVIGDEHISFTTSKIGSLLDVNQSKLYFKNAVISNNTTVQELQNKMWASYYHSVISDIKPTHDLCPDGEGLWFFYQQAVARGEAFPSHEKIKTFLNEVIAQYVKPLKSSF